MKKTILLTALLLSLQPLILKAQKTEYVKEFSNANHPEIGYWFISPNLLTNDRYLPNIDSIVTRCKYTMLFLTSREGSNFYDIPTWHTAFKNIVARAHSKGVKVGLQLWGNYMDKSMEGSQRMIIEGEASLDQSGNAIYTDTAKFIRFPDRLLKTDLFKVYAFKKTGDGFYDPATLKDITAQCETVLPDKKTVQVKIKAGIPGGTACVMLQEYCSQSSMWGDEEINGFKETMKAYSDIPFDGFALDEYGNKFIERIFDQNTTNPFRGRWYSTAMANAYQKETGKSLDKVLFDGRYAPQGKPEVRMSAINEYMDFTRRGATRVETAVYNASREIFGTRIFNGIHNTYHNSLVNDEIWANGIMWWNAPRAYGQTDEKTFLPTQMGVAMAHRMNAMYNQYYDKDLEPVLIKAFADLRYGVRTHYHALNDHRPNRFDLEEPEARDGINKIENCARLLNNFNPSLPDIKLLVIFGMEALSNWYPNEKERGVYDVNDKLKIEEKAVEIWKSGYLNALVPSDVIVDKRLVIGADGKPVMNGHTFDAILYLNPQYAREPVIKFLEEYVNKGGHLMVEGKADHDFNGDAIAARFKNIYDKASVKGYSIENLSKLGLQKNLLPDGCKNEDGSYTFNDRNSLITSSIASFSVVLDGETYTGQYKGLVVIKANKKSGIQKFAAAGCKELTRNGQVILSFKEPVDVFVERNSQGLKITIADNNKTIKPLINKL
jgi:hypothetical protein